MYYSSPIPISGSSSVGGLLCPGCEVCCDVIYCGELKFENGFDIVADKKKKKKKKKNKKIGVKERKEDSSVTSTKIIEAIKDVQQRAIYLQRKLKTMEKVKFETIKSCGRKERLQKTPKSDHRSCYCPTNPRIEKRHRTKSEPIKIKPVKYADEPKKKVEIEKEVEEPPTTTTRVEKKSQETETQTERTSSSSDKNLRNGEKELDKGDVEDEARRGSFFGGCAPCGLTCGFRYERENDSATSDVSARGENQKSLGCHPVRGSYRSRSRRRLTGVRSFPGGKSSNITARRTWCCC